MRGGRRLFRVDIRHQAGVELQTLTVYCQGGSIVNVERALQRIRPGWPVKVISYAEVTEDMILHV